MPAVCRGSSRGTAALDKGDFKAKRQEKQRNHDERRAHRQGRGRSPKAALPSYKLRAPEADGPEPKGEAEKLASPLTFTPLSGP